MTTRKSWTDPSVEGKALRVAFIKLFHLFKKEAEQPFPDIDRLCKLSITMGQTAHIKDILVKNTITKERIERLEIAAARIIPGFLPDEMKQLV